ncbi:hypothetical protein Nepgr_000097 [Nepenthes gracilis]|uniref:Uncharacterized protein n=1 Tax=Nepenthes gracilis TaxID=150966 RepID=A0AAD3P335_NEPGR|nr:hypothetical protein Nepgr_000097 [Nepenthes gracilis]
MKVAGRILMVCQRSSEMIGVVVCHLDEKLEDLGHHLLMKSHQTGGVPMSMVVDVDADGVASPMVLEG